jgi:NAD(P)-dependent dehydrogenase (short-subunit alcohol dehydrogenase family)
MIPDRESTRKVRGRMLEGKIAIVTGIGPGMGRSIALTFADHGADVVLAARNKDRLESVAEEVRALGREALVLPTDITDFDQCDRLVDATVERFGGVDVFVQNGHHAGDWKAVADADMGDWRHIMDVNFFGAFKLSQRVIPLMAERGGGRIVLVNSGAALRNPPTMGAYSSSKAALSSLARTLSTEVGPLGIMVNSLTLGPVAGENMATFIADDDADDAERVRLMEEKGHALPLGHLPTPDECAGAVLFLASPLAAAITGQNLVVNGGQWVTV